MQAADTRLLLETGFALRSGCMHLLQVVAGFCLSRHLLGFLARLRKLTMAYVVILS